MAEFEQIASTTFKTNSEEVRQTIVGNSKSVLFEPSIEIIPWEAGHGDCLRFWKDISVSVGVSVNVSDKSSLIWEDNTSKLFFATRESDFADIELPKQLRASWPKSKGAKLAWYLTEKPVADPDGMVRFVLKMSGYDNMWFHKRLYPGDVGYDPVPTHIDGSICVYHKEKANNSPGATFKAGKICQIYRPWVFDSLGTIAWGDLQYDLSQGTITKCFRKEVFENTSATWWLVDEDWGNTGGGSGHVFYTDDFISTTRAGHSPAADGTADSISAELYSESITARDMQCAIHLEADKTLVTNGATPSVNVGSSVDQYVEFPYSTKPTVLSATAYIMSVWGEGAAGEVYIYDDGVDVNGGYGDSNSSTFNWPSPLNASSANRKFFIYTTSTPSAGGRTTKNTDPLMNAMPGVQFQVQTSC